MRLSRHTSHYHHRNLYARCYLLHSFNRHLAKSMSSNVSTWRSTLSSCRLHRRMQRFTLIDFERDKWSKNDLICHTCHPEKQFLFICYRRNSTLVSPPNVTHEQSLYYYGACHRAPSCPERLPTQPPYAHPEGMLRPSHWLDADISATLGRFSRTCYPIYMI
jgi:hypothetical protein